MLNHPALLLIGHGSVRYPDAGQALLRHAAALRTQGYRAAAGFLNGAPSIADAMQAIGAAEVRAVPFFMEDGYFTRTSIPQALGGFAARMCPPIGLHPMLPTLIRTQALAAAEAQDLNPAATALLVVGHGSATAPGQKLALHQHTATLAALGPFARTEHACIEEAPFIADALAGMRQAPVIVVGYLANHGAHARHDVPSMIAEEAQMRTSGGPEVYFAGNVTDDPAMVRIILDHAGYHTFAAGV